MYYVCQLWSSVFKKAKMRCKNGLKPSEDHPSLPKQDNLIGSVVI